MNVNVVDIIKFGLTRVALLMIVVCILAPHVVNFNLISERIKVKRLNDNRPSFSELVNLMQQGQPVSLTRWYQYEAYFKLILTYMPDDHFSESFLGFTQFNLGKNKEGLEVLTKAANSAQILFWPDYNLGVYYYRQGQWQKAIDHLQRAVNVPINLPTKIMLESLVYRQVFASPSFKVSLADRMKSAYEDAYVLMLAAFDQLNLPQAGFGVAMNAIKNSPEDKGSFYYYAGLSALKLNQPDKALLLFNKTVAIDQQEPWAYLWLSKIYQTIGNTQLANQMKQTYEDIMKTTRFKMYDERITFRVF